MCSILALFLRLWRIRGHARFLSSTGGSDSSFSHLTLCYKTHRPATLFPEKLQPQYLYNMITHSNPFSELCEPSRGTCENWPKLLFPNEGKFCSDRNYNLNHDIETHTYIYVHICVYRYVYLCICHLKTVPM